ncbi:RNase H domain-containing protein [Trichonephila clavipes]|nr:RNase H domain-containing protein [Trichonephila clavipes]
MPPVWRSQIKAHKIHHGKRLELQWIPAHIDLEGNEIAYTLAKAGVCEVPEPSAPFTFLEIFSRTKHQNKTAWINPSPPEFHWYHCSHPGGSLAHGFTRQDQSLLARFRSGHIKTMKFSEGYKSFEMCTNCSSEPASPTHILECLGQGWRTFMDQRAIFFQKKLLMRKNHRNDGNSAVSTHLHRSYFTVRKFWDYSGQERERERDLLQGDQAQDALNRPIDEKSVTSYDTHT